jgi:hypothetical protein
MMMKAKTQKLMGFGLVVLGLAGAGSGSLPLVGVQTAVQADAERTITLDMGLDCRTFNYTRGLTLDQIVRGDGFIINGKIFRAGTLGPGTQSNDPNDPGSIGTYVSRGTSTATLAEHLTNPESPGVLATQYYLLNDGRGLVGEGWFAPSGASQEAVVGGMGAFRGASGEVFAVNIGTNITGCPNIRLTFSLKKQAPK